MHLELKFRDIFPIVLYCMMIHRRVRPLSKKYELCKSNGTGSINVEPHVVDVALKYLKKTRSGTNKKNLQCGNRVRDSVSRCRWYMESTTGK